MLETEKKKKTISKVVFMANLKKQKHFSLRCGSKTDEPSIASRLSRPRVECRTRLSASR